MIAFKMELSPTDMKHINFIMKNLDKKLGKRAVMKSFRMGAKPMIVAAKANAPVSGKKSFFTAHKHISKGIKSTKLSLHKAGELKRSIGVIIGRGGWNLYIGPRYGGTKINDAWYAHFVEFGTVSTGWGKGITKQPFMRPAWDQKNKASLDVIARELSKVVQNFLQRNKP